MIFVVKDGRLKEKLAEIDGTMDIPMADLIEGLLWTGVSEHEADIKAMNDIRIDGMLIAPIGEEAIPHIELDGLALRYDLYSDLKGMVELINRYTSDTLTTKGMLSKLLTEHVQHVLDSLETL